MAYAPWSEVDDAVRAVMKANRSKDTRPEWLVRKSLHELGYRFRTHVRELPGTPDLVFTKRKALVQVYGCFWHQHEGCSWANIPQTRVHYWHPKLARTVERDRENRLATEAAGWRTLVVWECELTRSPEETMSRVTDFLGPPRFAERGAIPLANSDSKSDLEPTGVGGYELR